MLRPVAEKLITKAKRGDLHNRREVLKTVRDKLSVVHELFTEIAPRFAERPGGYTRITKIGPRKGDNAPMAVIELVTEPYEPKAAAAAKKSAAKKSPAKKAPAKEASAAEAASAETATEETTGNHRAHRGDHGRGVRGSRRGGCLRGGHRRGRRGPRRGDRGARVGGDRQGLTDAHFRGTPCRHPLSEARAS